MLDRFDSLLGQPCLPMPVSGSNNSLDTCGAVDEGLGSCTLLLQRDCMVSHVIVVILCCCASCKYFNRLTLSK